MQIKLAKRMETFQPGIFNVLNDRKTEMILQGRTVYNLSVGTSTHSCLDYENVAYLNLTCRNFSFFAVTV